MILGRTVFGLPLGLLLALFGLLSPWPSTLVGAAPTDGTFDYLARLVCLSHPLTLFSVPSAASFYVRSLPDLHQDEAHPLHIYSGHLPSDPEAAHLPSTVVSAHLFFVLIKARKTADKERILFWFNVCSSLFVESSWRT